MTDSKVSGEQLATAVHLVRRHKAWWVLGGVLAAGGIIGDALRLLLLPALPWRQWLNAWTGGPLPPLNAPALLTTLVGVTLAAMALLALFWLAAVCSEATLIVATSAPAQPLRHSARAGWRAVGRLIALDALIFLPWFLAALAGMLLIGGLFAISLTQSLQGRSDAALGWLTAGFICWGPLLCLLTPLGYVSFIYRILAFREALLVGGGARLVVRRVWRRVRPHLGALLLWVLLLQGGALLFNLLLHGALLPATAMTTAVSAQLPPTWERPLRLGVIGLLLILSGGARALLQTFLAVAWTVAYREFRL